jgi:hypothetical protein
MFKCRFPHNHHGLNLWKIRPNDLPARNAALKLIAKTSSNYTRKIVREFELSLSLEDASRKIENLHA